ncbi:MAG: hypothetical protein K6G74_01515 [Bacilli bacterium]|nr:hypothetical protein [Bacilli bacterium]
MSEASQEAGSLSGSLTEPEASLSSSRSYGGYSIPKYSEKETSEQASSSKMRSLPLGYLSSLNNNRQYKVSIYQSNWISSESRYGNPRHDFDVMVDAGKPLYSNDEERQDLKARCRERYDPNGNAYYLDGFYSDEACTTFITVSFLVTSDINAYYRCRG